MPISDENLRQENFAYKDLHGDDKWELWTPVRVGWTDIGAPTVTGRFHVIGRQCFIQVQVIPSTSVATVAGTSYIELPIKAAGFGGDGSMSNAVTFVAIGACEFDVTNSRVYVPSQAATANTLTIAGWYEV